MPESRVEMREVENGFVFRNHLPLETGVIARVRTAARRPLDLWAAARSADENHAALLEQIRELRETVRERDRVAAELEREMRQREKAEAALRASQRLDSIGMLAGGIAHDFNNLLVVVLGHSELLLRNAPEGPLRAGLAQIQTAGMRAAELTGQLLAFGRRQVIEPRRLRVNDVLSRVRPMLVRLLPSNIEFVCEGGPLDCVVQADAGQLEQVVVNLAANARDAMAEGGQLRIETFSLDVDSEFAAAHPDATCGRYVVSSTTRTRRAGSLSRFSSALATRSRDFVTAPRRCRTWSATKASAT